MFAKLKLIAQTIIVIYTLAFALRGFIEMAREAADAFRTRRTQ
jgi:hypothetical protein